MKPYILLLALTGCGLFTKPPTTVVVAQVDTTATGDYSISYRSLSALERKGLGQDDQNVIDWIGYSIPYANSGGGKVSFKKARIEIIQGGGTKITAGKRSNIANDSSALETEYKPSNTVTENDVQGDLNQQSAPDSGFSINFDWWVWVIALVVILAFGWAWIKFGMK